MIQQWNNLPISQKTYLQASILPPVFQTSLQVEETRHRTILHLISMLALCLFLPQSFLLLCIRRIAPCSPLLVFAGSHFTIISCSNNDATMAMMATMCGGGSSRSYIAIIMSIWLICSLRWPRRRYGERIGSEMRHGGGGRILPFCNSDTYFCNSDTQLHLLFTAPRMKSTQVTRCIFMLFLCPLN